MNQITQIDPQKYRFSFYFTRHECHKVLTGTCSLELPSMKSPPYTSTGRASLEYCQDLYRSMEERGVSLPIYVHKTGCGHLDFTDGRHRTCIAKRKQLKIPAIITEGFMECNHCFKCKKSIFYKLQSMLGLSDTFIF